MLIGHSDLPLAQAWKRRALADRSLTEPVRASALADRDP
jgi:hypothetical protein